MLIKGRCAAPQKSVKQAKTPHTCPPIHENRIEHMENQMGQNNMELLIYVLIAPEVECNT